MEKVNESASSGSTSSGNIASSTSGLNFPLLKRLPSYNFFGYKEVPVKKEKK